MLRKKSTTQRSSASILPFPGGTGILAWTCEAFSWGGEGGVCMSGKAQGKHGETPFKYQKSAFDLHHKWDNLPIFMNYTLRLWGLTWHLQTISKKIMNILCNISTFLGFETCHQTCNGSHLRVNPGGVAGRWCMASLGRDMGEFGEGKPEGKQLTTMVSSKAITRCISSKQRKMTCSWGQSGRVCEWTAFSFTSMMFSFWCFLFLFPRLCKFKHYIYL